MATTTTPQRGQYYVKRRSGACKELAGFTKKPDGIRRARMIDMETGRETKIKVDQLTKSYEPVDY